MKCNLMGTDGIEITQTILKFNNHGRPVNSQIKIMCRRFVYVSQFQKKAWVGIINKKQLHASWRREI